MKLAQLISISFFALTCTSTTTTYAEPVKTKDQVNGTKSSAPALDTITGFYATRYGSTLSIKRMSPTKIKYQLQAFYPSANPSLAERPGGPNMGIAEGEATLKGNTAIVVPEDTTNCKITIIFQGNSANVNQDGCAPDCGFGMNVSATGKYIKKSSRPNFQKFD